MKILVTISEIFEVLNVNNVNGVVSGGHMANVNSTP